MVQNDLLSLYRHCCHQFLFIMHKEMNSALGLPALSQKNFRKQLVYDLVGDELSRNPVKTHLVQLLLITLKKFNWQKTCPNVHHLGGGIVTTATTGTRRYTKLHVNVPPVASLCASFQLGTVSKCGMNFTDNSPCI